MGVRDLCPSPFPGCECHRIGASNLDPLLSGFHAERRDRPRMAVRQSQVSSFTFSQQSETSPSHVLFFPVHPLYRRHSSKWDSRVWSWDKGRKASAVRTRGTSEGLVRMDGEGRTASWSQSILLRPRGCRPILPGQPGTCPGKAAAVGTALTAAAAAPAAGATAHPRSPTRTHG